MQVTHNQRFESDVCRFAAPAPQAQRYVNNTERTLKIMAFVILGLLLPTLSAAENDTEKRILAERLITITNTEALLISTRSQMDQAFGSMMKQISASESEQPIMEKFMAKFVAGMRAEVTWEKLKEPLIEIYMQHFSSSELSDFVAFYETPSGKKMIEKMPLIVGDTTRLTQTLIKNFYPRMKDLSQELREELAAARRAK